MIYGQSWRGSNMSLRNPMTKAAMNNNPMGNQQTLTPNGPLGQVLRATSQIAPSPGMAIKNYNEPLQNWQIRLNKEMPEMNPPVHVPVKDPQTPYPLGQMMAPPSMQGKNGFIQNPIAMPNGPDAFQPNRPIAPKLNRSPNIPTSDPQTPYPLGRMMAPPSMQGEGGVIQNPALNAQANRLMQNTAAVPMRQQWQQIAANTPPYINPKFRDGQLNAPAQPALINPNAARNVLAGQPQSLDRTVQPLNIPGMKFDPQQNAMVRMSPYEARGIAPGSLRNDPIMAFEKFNNSPDDFRVATGGMAMIPPPAARNIDPQQIQDTRNNARIARAARMRGVTSAGIDQWRAQSPIAKAIAARQPAAPQVPQIAPQVPQAAPQVPQIAPQVPNQQDTGLGDWGLAMNPPTISTPESSASQQSLQIPPAMQTDGLSVVNRNLANQLSTTIDPSQRSALKNKILANEAKQYETANSRRQATWRAIQKYWPNYSN